jgi:uncharacterized protein
MIQTFTGVKVNPANPRSTVIHIADIAHSLANQCRYVGHVPKFYSVAQHSVLVSKYLEGSGFANLALHGLLHDASEAYMHDISRCLKRKWWMIGYRVAEWWTQRKILKSFGLSVLDREDTFIIKKADQKIAVYEQDLRATHPHVLGNRVLGPVAAEAQFLRRWKELTK